jgi:hypothetical protein
VMVATIEAGAVGGWGLVSDVSVASPQPAAKKRKKVSKYSVRFILASPIG